MAGTGESLNRPSVSVAIPAYEAAASVGDVVHRARGIIDDVLVVDDGSADATAEVGEAAGARVIRHSANRGKGKALRTAFTDLFGRGTGWVVTLDADGQHLPEDIPPLIEAAVAGADLVIGCRDRLFEQMHAVRRASNRWSSVLISHVAGQPVSDVQSGFRVYSRRLIECAGFPEDRFDAESAVVVRAVRLGFRVVSAPIRLGFADGRTTSHYRPVVDSLRIARSVTRARFEMVGQAKERLP